VVAMILDIFHHLEFLQTWCFQKLDLFPPSGVREERLLLGWFHKKELVLAISLISGDGNKSSLRSEEYLMTRPCPVVFNFCMFSVFPRFLFQNPEDYGSCADKHSHF
jgi:hypothetical protein